MQIYDEFDVSCSGRPIAPPNVISREKLCNHDTSTGFWVKTHAKPLPNELVSPQQLVTRSYSDSMCTTNSQFPIRSTRSVFIDKCMPVYYTKHLQPGFRQRLPGDILYYRKISYVSGPVGGISWDEGVKLTGGAGSATGTGVLSGSSQGRILLGDDIKLTLLVSRFNFEDDKCTKSPKTTNQVQYVLQAASPTGPSCLPDPLFPGTFYHVGDSVRPSAVPTAKPTDPTAVPTPRPTRLPTTQPTPRPTHRPTPKPSNRPSAFPTLSAPTPLPTTYLSTLTFNGSSIAVGSSLHQDASYIYYVFMNNGSITPITSGVAHDILLVAGGGGGGQGHAGGGGAGGVIAYMNQSLPVGVAISVVVGQGGAGAPSSTPNSARAQGFNGGHSLFGSLIAYGGGGGGSYTETAGPQGAGRGGGSGGGGGGNPSTVIGGSAVTGQGYGGGAGYTCDIAGRGGGGGGAGSVGGSASGTGTCTSIGSGSGGTGGAAVSTVTSWGSLASVLGLSGLGFWGQIAGGGGGGSWGSGVISPGGKGGAGSAPGAASSNSDYANAGQAALPSTGSGGGGGPEYSVGGGAGGSGFVVVRVAKSSKLALSKVPDPAPPPPPLAASFLFSQPSSTFIGTSSSTILVLPSTVSDVRAIVLTGGTFSGSSINWGSPLAGTALPVTPSADFPSSASTTYWYLFCLDGLVKTIIVKVFLSSGSVYFQAISAWYATAANGLPSKSAAVDALYAAKSGTMNVVTSSTGSGYGVCGLQGAAYFDGKSLPVTYYPTVSFPGGVALAQANLLGTILSLPSKYTLSFDLLPTATPASDWLGILQLISAEALFTVTSSAVDIYSDGGGAILRLMHMTSGRFLIDSFNLDGGITSSLLSDSIAPVVPLRKTTTVTITMDLTGGSASAFTIWMTGGVSFSKTTTFTPKTTAFANVRVFAVPPTNPGIGASAPASALIRNVKITPGVVPAPPLV